MEKMSVHSYFSRFTSLSIFFGFINSEWGITEMRKIVGPRWLDDSVATIPQEILALATAIIYYKNVTIDPHRCPMSLVGKVRKKTPYVQRLATLDSGVVLCRKEEHDQIITSDICSIYFEKVVWDEKDLTELHIHTRNTDYCLGDIHKVLQSPFFKYVTDNNLEMEDYKRFFSDINDDYQKIEIGA